MAIDPQPLREALFHHAAMCRDKYARTGDPAALAELLDTIGRLEAAPAAGTILNGLTAPERPARTQALGKIRVFRFAGQPVNEAQIWHPENQTRQKSFQLDMLGLILRLRQIRNEGGLIDSGVIADRVITCDLPRLERHLTPEQWAWIRWAENS